MPDARGSGIRIHYEVEGDGPPLVLHHGLAGTGYDFVDFGYVEGLSGFRRLVRIDARGHGQSDKPHDAEAYTPQQMAKDVVAVLDDLDVEQADFFGYSMGGLIAFAVAKYAPDRIRSYVIGGVSPYPPEDTIRTLWSALKGGPDTFAQLANQDGPIPPAWEARMRASDYDALRAYFRSPTVAPDPLDDVPATIKAPCLLIVGEDDWGLAGVNRCAEQMPTATLVVLPGLNHASGFVRSDLMLPHIKAFLNQIDAGVS
jgi:pimeloyl-ACP methyl ester carboxylesterase